MKTAYPSHLGLARACAAAFCIGVLQPALALAQDELDAAAEEETEEEAGEEIEEEAEEETGEEAEEETGEEESVAGWFRVDTDGLGTQLWFGATHQVGGLAIASDIYLVGTFAELDVGVALSLGDLTLTPMVGVGFDFSSDVLSVASLIAPQLFTVYDRGSIYVESWVQLFINSPFDTGQDSFYTRNFVLYKVSESVHVGPQFELGLALDESAEGADDAGLTSLPLGGRVNLGYGENNTLGIFVGFDTQAPDGTDGVTGRFTFIRTW